MSRARIIGLAIGFVMLAGGALAATPAAIPLPAQWTQEELVRQRGALKAWVDKDDSRIAAMDPRAGANQKRVEALFERQRRAEAAGKPGPLSSYLEALGQQIQGVSGYFYVPDGGPFLPGPRVLKGSWNGTPSWQQSQPLFRPSDIELSTIEGQGRCGATRLMIPVSEVTYLGPSLDPAWRSFAALAATSPSEPFLDKTAFNFVRPEGFDLARFYPSRAMNTEIEGRATAACLVTTADGAVACIKTSETPPDYGFGDALIRLSRYVKLQSKTGPQPINRCAELGVFFRLP